MLARMTFSWKLAAPTLRVWPAAWVPVASRPLSASHALAAAVGCVGLVDQRQDVLRRVEVLRVLEDDEVVRLDGRVGGEDVRRVDLAVLQRVDGQGAAGVELLERA